MAWGRRAGRRGRGTACSVYLLLCLLSCGCREVAGRLPGGTACRGGGSPGDGLRCARGGPSGGPSVDLGRGADGVAKRMKVSSRTTCMPDGYRTGTTPAAARAGESERSDGPSPPLTPPTRSAVDLRLRRVVGTRHTCIAVWGSPGHRWRACPRGCETVSSIPSMATCTTPVSWRHGWELRQR